MQRRKEGWLLVVDSREKPKKDGASVLTRLQQLGLDPVVGCLKFGDIALFKADDLGLPTGDPAFLIERKRETDFTQSATSGRLISQIAGMIRDCLGPKIILIEGPFQKRTLVFRYLRKVEEHFRGQGITYIMVPDLAASARLIQEYAESETS